MKTELNLKLWLYPSFLPISIRGRNASMVLCFGTKLNSECVAELIRRFIFNVKCFVIETALRKLTPGRRNIAAEILNGRRCVLSLWHFLLHGHSVRDLRPVAWCLLFVSSLFRLVNRNLFLILLRLISMKFPFFSFLFLFRQLRKKPVHNRWDFYRQFRYVSPPLWEHRSYLAIKTR